MQNKLNSSASNCDKEIEEKQHNQNKPISNTFAHNFDCIEWDIEALWTSCCLRINVQWRPKENGKHFLGTNF